MNKAEKNLPPRRFRLVQTKVIRPRRVTFHATLSEALDTFKPWVGFGEAARIFEKSFGL